MIREFLQKKRGKKELLKCFRQGGIYLKYERNEQEFYVYPKIHSVVFKDNCREYCFTLPVGIDPSLLDKRFYVFRQMFGPNVFLEHVGNDKSFTLKVFKNGLPSLVKFDFDKFKPKMETCNIPIIMGVDHTGEFNVFDLKKFHHVQITGITNVGKSVYLKAILTALALYFSPDQLHFWLADLKRAELTQFKSLAHTQHTVTSLDDLENMLHLLLDEVNRRYELIEEYEVSHLDEVNKQLEKPLPHIICMIDEFGLCSESKEILKLVQDLTSIARAANVYLFLSLQRADSTVITGIAKNNLGVRISFKQSNGINAKIAGVEGVDKLKLSDKGRAIMDVGSEIKLIQCPLITTEEVKSLIKPYIVDKPKNAGGSRPVELTEDEILGGL